MLLCLCNAAALFPKGSDRILVQQTGGYYKRLLALADLTGLHERPNFDLLIHVHFQASSKGLPLPAFADAAAAAGAMLPPPGMLALEDKPPPGGLEPPTPAVALAPAVAAPAPAALVPAPTAAFALAPIRIVGATVWFDNFTHASGKRRALCVCHRCSADDGRCEKDVSLLITTISMNGPLRTSSLGTSSVSIVSATGLSITSASQTAEPSLKPTEKRRWADRCVNGVAVSVIVVAS